RLPVLLQRRKSALAGSTLNAKAVTTSAAQASMVPGRRRRRQIPVLVCRSLIPSASIRLTVRASISREPLRAVNEDSPEVVHVGQCRSGCEQITYSLEEFRRIIVIKKGGRIEAEMPGAVQRGRVHEGARRVVGPSA